MKKLLPVLTFLLIAMQISCVSDGVQSEMSEGDSALNSVGIDTFVVGKQLQGTGADSSGLSPEAMEVDTAMDNMRREIFGTSDREGEVSANVAIERNPDVAPSFPGGSVAMDKFITRNLIYPLVAFQNDIAGTVQVRFVVEADGRLSGITVIKSLGYGCDEAAADLIKSMPLWVPGKKLGRNVRCAVVLPIEFERRTGEGY